MTGSELVGYALALLGEPGTSATDYSEYSLLAANVLLTECFGVNNSIRRAMGKEPLEKPRVLESLGEDLGYEDRLARECLSYGLAAKLILEDNDFAKFNYFNGMYVQAQRGCQVARQHTIRDRYGGDGE